MKKRTQSINLTNGDKRTAQAGKNMANALIGMVDLWYLDDNAIEGLTFMIKRFEVLLKGLRAELKRRRKEWLDKGRTIKE